jgi:hypothetical protein
MLIITLLLAGCGGGGDKATQTPAMEDPQEIVDQAVRSTRQAESFRLVIERSGAPVYVETTSALEGMVEFMRAAGAFVLPNRVQVTVKIRLGDLVSQAEFMAVGPLQYLMHSTLTGGRWLNYNFLSGFDPGAMLAEGGSLERALGSVRDLTLIGIESLYGTDAYHVRGIGNGDDVAAFTLGLVGGSDVEVDAWVDIANMYVLRIDILEPNRPIPEDETEPPFWSMEIYDYNSEVDVDVPENAIEAQVTIPAPDPTPNPAGAVAPPSMN